MKKTTSQEIVSALTVIKGYSDLISRMKLTEEQVSEYSQLINNEITILENLLSPILDMDNDSNN